MFQAYPHTYQSALLFLQSFDISHQNIFSEGSLILINSYAPFSPYHSLQYDSAQLRLPDNLRNVPQEDQNPFAHQDLPRHP